MIRNAQLKRLWNFICIKIYHTNAFRNAGWRRRKTQMCFCMRNKANDTKFEWAKMCCCFFYWFGTKWNRIMEFPCENARRHIVSLLLNIHIQQLMRPPRVCVERKRHDLNGTIYKSKCGAFFFLLLFATLRIVGLRNVTQLISLKLSAQQKQKNTQHFTVRTFVSFLLMMEYRKEPLPLIFYDNWVLAIAFIVVINSMHLTLCTEETKTCYTTQFQPFQHHKCWPVSWSINWHLININFRKFAPRARARQWH